MARKRTFAQKRKRVQRKKSIFPKLLIGAGVIGGGYLLYTKVIKPYLNANKDTTDTTSTDTAINTTVNAASNTTPNVTSATVSFSPLGTPFENLKLNTPITYGSKGEEIKNLQTILNASRNLLIQAGYKPTYNKITIDGVFGTQTWEAVKTIEPKALSLNTWLKYYTNLANRLGFQKAIGGTTDAGGSAGFYEYGGVR